MQLIKQLHDIASKNMESAPEKLFFLLLTVKNVALENHFDMIKPIQSKLAATHSFCDYQF